MLKLGACKSKFTICVCPTESVLNLKRAFSSINGINRSDVDELLGNFEMIVLIHVVAQNKISFKQQIKFPRSFGNFPILSLCFFKIIAEINITSFRIST